MKIVDQTISRMGSAALLESDPKMEKSTPEGSGKSSGMKSKVRARSKATPSDADKMNIDKQAATNSKKKRNAAENVEESSASRKMPKRAAACSDFKEKSKRVSESKVDKQKEHVVEEETSAIRLTSGPDDPRTNRRLTDFIFHDANGNPQPFEMLEIDDLFISGVILSWDESSDKKKEKGARCQGFGRIEEWAISGYDEGSPIIWVSTDIADYDCVKPAASYRKFYDLFFEKARACLEVFKKLPKSSGANNDISLDELLAGVARSLSGIKSFVGGTSAKDFVLSHGEFIYNQLIGLEQSSSKNSPAFADMPALIALRDESRKRAELNLPQKAKSNGTLKIKDVDQMDQSSTGVAEEGEDQKLARLLQEEEMWNSMQKKNKRQTSGSSKFYIKINEDEIANDYPLPAYYKTSQEETDEYLVFDSDIGICDPDALPKSILHNWALYDADSRLISLELLPMKSCDEVDVTIFGSGTMTNDDGSRFCLDSDPVQSSSGASETNNTDGIPIFLSAIKEWVIEFGASMVFISIRTDMAWYRLGKPSKQYAPWYNPVLKTAKVAIAIITLLKEQSRVSKLSFVDIIKRVAEFEKEHPAYLSSSPVAVESYVVAHGQIILQQFAEYPDKDIRNCAFVTRLSDKMEQRHHTKLIVKKKAVVKTERILNPRASMAPVVSKRKAMQATTTRLISRIWGEYYSNYTPEDPKEEKESEPKEEEDAEEQEQEENEEEEVDEKVLPEEKINKPSSASKGVKPNANKKGICWDGKPLGKTSSGEALYRTAMVRGYVIEVGGAVAVESEDSEEVPNIFYVEYMFESSDGKMMCHGLVMERGSETVLGNTANERELFLTNECMEFEVGDIKETVVVDIRSLSWGHQYRKENALAERSDRQRAEERKQRDLPMEYYCKSLYYPEKGCFLTLPRSSMGMGTGDCRSCRIKEAEKEKETFSLSSSKTAFTHMGVTYSVNDFVYISPDYFTTDVKEQVVFKSGRNVGLKSYAVGQILDIEVPKSSKKTTPESTVIKVRRFFRPDDISSEKAYASDIREVYYSEEVLTVPVDTIKGKCEVRKKQDLPSHNDPVIFDHIFFCEYLYDPVKGSIKQVPANAKLRFTTGKVAPDAAARKRKGKGKAGESDGDVVTKPEASVPRLATLDIFAGCGGLSEGLQKAGITSTKWAIEYEEPAGDAFNLNHPDSLMFIDNCNVILRAIMEKGGDADDCISTPEASDLAAKLGEEKLSNLPMPGQVDFINGGPPCQGFSGMNRFNQGTWSKVQCEMILAFLSFADYFRPRYFLLENVRTFVSFNKGQTFRLTLASLLEMGYQVKFGVLDAGAYGVSQSRKRAFIWAAAPEEILPEWPEPMHVFAGPELKIPLPGNPQYAAVRSTASGAPFRSITVRDTIGDLPPVGNGASKLEMEYGNEAVSWFQRQIRANMMVLTDHISKEMNELNLIRCQKIPKRPGCDWRDLPDEKVKLSTGQLVALIPWCLPNTAKRHNEWKGLFGRLDWEGNFPTSITDPQPMGKVGMCFHPDQDRILSVRECARSQGFPDSYKFAGNIQNKHRQIGNAVPPPLAFALGKKLKEAVEKKLASE